MTNADGYQAVMRLAGDRGKAERWLPFVAAAHRRAVYAQNFSGEFAGAWVLEDVGHWVPNLRALTAFGIIERSGPTSRGGRRAYYRMPDIEGVARALTELGLSLDG